MALSTASSWAALADQGGELRTQRKTTWRYYKTSQHGGIADLVAFTDRHREVLTDQTSRAGCLMANAMVAGDAPEAVSRYLRVTWSAFDAALARSAHLGEISDTHRQSRSALMLSAVIGLSIMAKGGANRSELDELAGGLRDTILNWLVTDTGPTQTER